MSSWAADWSALWATGSGVAFIAAALWWVIRRRRKELRMPIIRILKIPQTKLPRIVVKKPPLIPFVAFLLAAISFAVWTSKPRSRVFVNHDPHQLRIHIFVDMSPSMSSHVTTAELAKTVSGLWPSIGGSSRITMSTSHSDAIYELRDAAQTEDVIQGLGFHRAGVRIGTALKTHLAQTGEVDRILIVSDRDQHSWSGFQWQYLQDDAEVFFVNVDSTSEVGVKPNAFINRVRRMSPPGALSSDWEIEVAQGGLVKPQEGTLRVSWRGEMLASTSWRLADGRRTVSVNMSWPSNRLPVSTSGEPLVWEIIPQGEDAVTMDNEYRTSISGRGGLVTVIAEPTGELPLEDAANSLLTVLRVIGLQAERVDFAGPKTDASESVDQSKGKSRPYSPNQSKETTMTVMLGGLGHGVDTFCSLNDRSLHNWVVPWGDAVDHSELCACVSRLIHKSTNECEGIHTREQWMDWLVSIGGKQLGGEIGQNKTAVAFRMPSVAGPGDVVALSIPLAPSRTFGVDYGKFPLLVRELLTLEAKDIKEGGVSGAVGEDWPRENDLSSNHPLEAKSDQPFAEPNQMRLSNVPLGESLLATLPVGQLPPLWVDGRSDVLRRGNGKLDSEDPLPWLRGLIALALIATTVDVVWNVIRRRALVKNTALLWISILWFYGGKAVAQVQMEFFHNPAASTTAFTRVAREVSSRTSIEFINKAQNIETVEQAGELPWLWIRSPERLMNKNGEMSAEMIRWVKRGGFLVIESTGSDDVVWEKFTKPLLSGTFKPTGWRPVPQEHELMRSFYLLETLPACNGHIWKWFGVDGRLAILQIPYHFSDLLQDQPARSTCEAVASSEYQTRVFVNILMVALTTDYKRDQIHLPEILKRLRMP